MKLALNTTEVLNKGNEIYVKVASDISFFIEEIENNVLLDIKVSFSHIDLDPVEELQICEKCKRKAPNSSFINLIQNGDFDIIEQQKPRGHHIISIKFGENIRRIDKFVVQFNCSASHIKQKSKLRLQFMQRNSERSKEESVGEFWVNVTEFPSRAFDDLKGMKRKASKHSTQNSTPPKLMRIISVPSEEVKNFESFILEKNGTSKYLDEFYL